MGERLDNLKNKIEGEAQELKGKITGDKVDQAAGKAKSLGADIKDKALDVEKAAEEKIDEMKKK